MPLPENETVANPTKVDPESKNIRVKFIDNFNFAYGGVEVVRYVTDQVADVNARCVEVGLDEEKLVKVDEDTDLYDPRLDSKRKKKKAITKAITKAPENKSIDPDENK